MNKNRVHYDGNDEGYFIVHKGEVYKPIISTKFDEGDAVEVLGPEYSSSYVIVRSLDMTIVESWKAKKA